MRLSSFFNRQAALVLVASGLTACGGGGYDPPDAPQVAASVAPEVTKVTLTGEQEAPNVIATAASFDAFALRSFDIGVSYKPGGRALRSTN